MNNNIYFADNIWTQCNINPFTSDGTYGNSWSAFIYDESILGYTNVFHHAKV